MRLRRFWLALALLVLVVGSIPGASVRAQNTAARPPFRYGIIVSNSSHYPQVNQLGFGWVKVDFSWNVAEPSQGSFNFSPYDNAVTQARASNLQIVALIQDTPAWANGTGVYNPYSPPPSSSHMADFGAFMGALAAHYKGQIAGYEIWNEENVSGTWGNLNPDPSVYFSMIQAASPQIRAADPDALIVTGGVANTQNGNGSTSIGDLIYLQDILGMGAANYVDAIGIHPYPGACAPSATSCAQTPGTYFQRASEEHDTVSTYTSLPLWITEAGYFAQPAVIDPAAAGCNSSNGLGGFTSYELDENTRANDLVSAFQTAYQDWPWLGAFFLMNLDISMDPNATCYPARFWSLLTASGGQTQSFTALASMTKNAPLVSFSSTYNQVAGTITVNGTLNDPSLPGNPGIQDVIASVGTPYGPGGSTGLVPTSYSSNGSFQFSVDTSHMTYNVTTLVYVYVLTATQGWNFASIGIVPGPQANATPESLSFWIDPSGSRIASATIAMGRNDSTQTYYWSASSNQSWLSVPTDSNHSSSGVSSLPVTINAASLVPGTYSATITVDSDSGTKSWLKNLPMTIPVTLTVGTKPTYKFHVYLPISQDGAVPDGL